MSYKTILQMTINNYSETRTRNWPPRPGLTCFLNSGMMHSGAVRAAHITNDSKLVSLFASLLAIPLACQCCFHAALLTGLQIVGVTFYFLDDVLLLYLPLKPAQRVFERLAFLYANLCQEIPPPNPPNGHSHDTEFLSLWSKNCSLIFLICIDIVQA